MRQALPQDFRQGDCLSACPTGAISFEEREAAKYDEDAVKAKKAASSKPHPHMGGCPKLDSTYYSDKLAEIIKINDIKSLTVVRMEVPCCGGIEAATKKALLASGKFIP